MTWLSSFWGGGAAVGFLPIISLRFEMNWVFLGCIHAKVLIFKTWALVATTLPTYTKTQKRIRFPKTHIQN